ncbi:hypothetical protein ACSQ67_005735 [Phaseolus vulgaris]
MNAVICSGYIVILYLLNLQLVAVADNGSYVPTENIVLNCGSSTSEFVQYDGRNWSGDIVSPYVPSNADTKSLVVRAPNTLQSIPEAPYMTARIFHSQFTYTFNVTPGPKFIRLHFYPASYMDLNISNAFLSVSAANFTLLHNFSASLNAEYYNLAYFMKEFIVHVSGSVLQLTFSPSYNASRAFAFVNGIEVVSMPLNLYMRGDDGDPLPLVGHDNKVVNIYNDSAMETLYRVNVGGEQIPSKYDTGMFRTWDTDEVYLFGAIGLQPCNMSMLVLYSDDAPPYSAPADVYRTSRSMGPSDYGLVNLNYNMTWFFPVDSGFLYLVRLHFCEIDQQDLTKINQVVFTVFLNNQTAEEEADVIGWGGGEPGVAVHRDYVVMVPHVNEGKQDLWLDLHPYQKAKPMYYNAFLNGVEIFKLSNFGDKSLAGLNPPKSFFSDAKGPHWYYQFSFAYSYSGEDGEHVNLAEWTMSCLENGNVEQIVDPNLKENITKECFELYLGVVMKCLAERGAERPSIGEVLENLVLAMHLQKNEGNVPNGNERRSDNVVLQGNSDLTPGVEFSEIMMPIGR